MDCCGQFKKMWDVTYQGKTKQNQKQQKKFKYLKGHDSKGHVGLKSLGTTLAFGVSYSPLRWCRI